MTKTSRRSLDRARRAALARASVLEHDLEVIQEREAKLAAKRRAAFDKVSAAAAELAELEQTIAEHDALSLTGDAHPRAAA